MRALQGSRDWVWDWMFYVVFGMGLALCLRSFLDYGLTFDEDLSRTYAEGILRWFQTLGTDRHDALEFRNLYFYGGFFEVLAQSVGRNFPAGVFEGRHLVNVLFGLLGVWGTRRLGTVVGGARAGFWAGLFLLVNPVYYGHSFNNPKDIPFAALSAWALVAMFEATRAIPKVRWTQVVGTGVATGLMLGVRPGGVFFFGYMVILWSSGLLMALRQTGARWKECRGDVGRLLLNVAAVAAVSWIVMLAFWPFGQIAPLSNPLRAMRETTNFGWAGPVLLNGNFELSTDLPWTYLPTYFAISLPEFYYLGLLCGVSAAAVAILRRRLSGRSALFLGMLIFMTVFPVAMAIALRSTLYDGLRHFLFLMPVLAVLSGWGFSAAWDGLQVGWPRLALMGTALGLIAWVLVDMVQLHPYQSLYYNRVLAGGLRGAAGRFETDYWGQSYKEATEWVMANYRPSTSQPIRVANCSISFLSEYFLEKEPAPRRFVGSDLESTHVFMATTRDRCYDRAGRLLKVIERQGVGLVYVFELRRPLP